MKPSLGDQIIPGAVPVGFGSTVAPRGSFHDADDYRSRFPDGRIGSNPALATVEAGERLYRAAVEDVIGDYDAFLAAD